MKVNERLKQVVDLKSKSPRAFAIEIGIPSQTLGNYLKEREPSFDLLKRVIETFVDINPRWLITGEGEMLVNDNPSQDIRDEIIRNYMKAEAKHAEQLDKLISVIDKLSEK